ncbi:alpha/beta hydrolase [Nocardioides nanhaiensis]|uniref:AB hydrolase-1 domain-containing protein n=1 Tax=Nocardioides nanhaiensis TaxID=1476871 RepID=A0ABP8VZB0_9ACTN
MTTDLRGRERMMDVAGVELCAESFGDPQAPPLLLLHGAATSMDGWPADLCRLLAGAGWHVVRYDHRDTGRSTTWPAGEPGYPGRALTEDAVVLTELLAAEAGGRVLLVGLSMGGGIAQEVALRRPELVAGLVLVATTAVGGVEQELPGPLPELASWFESPPPPPDPSDPAALVEAMVAAERAFSGPDFDEHATRGTARDVVARSHDPAAADNHWLVLGDDGDDGGGDDRHEPLDVRRLRVPTLVVHGGADPLFPLPHGEALAAAVPGARLLVVERMGHEVPPATTWPRLLDEVARMRR